MNPIANKGFSTSPPLVEVRGLVKHFRVSSRENLVAEQLVYLGLASGGASLHVFRHAWFASAGIAALALVANLGLTPRKKVMADPSALLREPAQASTLLTPGKDA